MTMEQLTDREQRVLEHLRRAQELKMGLAEYARRKPAWMSGRSTAVSNPWYAKE